MNERMAPSQIGEVIKETLKRLGIKKSSISGLLPGEWRGLVGEKIANYSRILGFRKGVLLIEVGSSSLLYEIEVIRREEILTKIRERFPTKNIRGLKCIIRDV